MLVTTNKFWGYFWLKCKGATFLNSNAIEVNGSVSFHMGKIQSLAIKNV